MIEDVNIMDSKNQFIIKKEEQFKIKNNQYIREIGNDIKSGSCVLKSGKLLNE